jgi:hypothetical protein
MKNILFAVGLIFAFKFEAMAVMPVAETVETTATVKAVSCSTSTATRMDLVFVSGKNRAWARIQNQDTSANIYIGFDTDVSTNTASGNLGEKIEAGGNAPYNIGKSIKIYCKSDGSSAATASISQFGY